MSNEHAEMRKSLIGLDGFMVAVTPYPYEVEEFDLSSSSTKLNQIALKRLGAANVPILSNAQYSAAVAPGSLQIIIEYGRFDDVYRYAGRALVLQIAVLEKDYKNMSQDGPNTSTVVTWMTPRLRTGETSVSIWSVRAEKLVTDLCDDFIAEYRQAFKEAA